MEMRKACPEENRDPFQISLKSSSPKAESLSNTYESESACVLLFQERVCSELTMLSLFSAGAGPGHQGSTRAAS